MEKRTDRLTYKSSHGGYGYSHDLDMYDPEIKDYIGRLEDEKDNVECGEWVDFTTLSDGSEDCRCSICGAGDTRNPTVIVPYCWKCGSKMKEENCNESACSV